VLTHVLDVQTTYSENANGMTPDSGVYFIHFNCPGVNESGRARKTCLCEVQTSSDVNVPGKVRTGVDNLLYYGTHSLNYT
jgi:hypothetical protein